ncbi:hypothetical protein A0H81_02446 [Grifola frondosa]|uniref:Uncharacterized protein n=1 Tax=Grifola frondosa TaxID=5627 RepID=A0A1C7MN52_GRIFR|nr:hypothetical protein A0H81_02446 [Grifola frondosa]
MVSPAPTASDNPPPLSYADRAKKAQNIRQKSQLASQRSPSQGTSAAPLTISASTVPGTSSVPSGSLAASTVSKPSSPSANTDVASTFPLPSASTPSSPHPLVDTNGSKVNGDVNHSDSVSSVPLATKPSPASPMNVWNIRKEQMAQARARQAPSSSLPSSQKPLQNQNTAFPSPSSSHPRMSQRPYLPTLRV